MSEIDAGVLKRNMKKKASNLASGLHCCSALDGHG